MANVAMFRTSPNTGKSIFAGDLPMMQRTGLKSEQDQEERQQKAQSQIAFWESRKESLKNRECVTLEDIAEKLDRFHSYESKIAAVKTQYNREQMWHTMDEARELGQKIAEEAEKFEPKTAEERREDMAKEALGTDESKGGLTESINAIQEEMQEEMTELTEDASRSMEETAESAGKTLDSVTEESMETMEAAAGAEMSAGSAGPLLEQAETAEQLLEKLKSGPRTEAAEDIAVTAAKISEEGKGTQVDYTI